MSHCLPCRKYPKEKSDSQKNLQDPPTPKGKTKSGSGHHQPASPASSGPFIPTNNRLMDMAAECDYADISIMSTSVRTDTGRDCPGVANGQKSHPYSINGSTTVNGSTTGKGTDGFPSTLDDPIDSIGGGMILEKPVNGYHFHPTTNPLLNGDGHLDSDKMGSGGNGGTLNPSRSVYDIMLDDSVKLCHQLERTLDDYIVQTQQQHANQKNGITGNDGGGNGNYHNGRSVNK